MTARARTLSPNSTAATKLLPLVPYHRFVPGYARAPNDANDPQRADVNPTGVLGALCVAAVPDGPPAKQLFRQLLIWGVSMAVVGGLICQLLALPLARA